MTSRPNSAAPARPSRNSGCFIRRWPVGGAANMRFPVKGTRTSGSPSSLSSHKNDGWTLPAFVVVDISELIFNHGASTPADQARLAEGAPSDDRRADNQSIDRSSERRLRELPCQRRCLISVL